MKEEKNKKDSKNPRDSLILNGLAILDRELIFFKHKANLKRVMSDEDIEDMRGECVLDMIKTVKRYDPSRGTVLSTFLTPRIKGSFKDYLRKQSKYKQIRLDSMSKSIVEEIHKVMETDKSTITVQLDMLDVTDDTFHDILIDMGTTDAELVGNLYETILSLPDIRVYILLSYYVMNKGIKEIAEELDMSPSSGWIYRIKRQSVQHIKKELESKLNNKG
jgi:RNA polymerase sigma factor (sigma-70 family)